MQEIFTVGKLRATPWLVLLSVSLGLIMVGLDSSAVIIANPQIAKDLGASLGELQWVTNAYLLTLAAFLIFGGKLGDRHGNRAIFLAGIVGFGLSSIAVGISKSIIALIVFRGFQGAFGAMLIPNTLALLRTSFPSNRFGMAVGVWSGAAAVSTAAGPIIGGLLVERVSWQSVFYINAPVSAVAVLIGSLVLFRSSASKYSEPVDTLGVLLLGSGLFCLVLGTLQAGKWGLVPVLALLAGSLVFITWFVIIELRRVYPLIQIKILQNRSLIVGIAATFIGFFALLGIMFFLVLYLQNVHGYTAIQTGIRLLPLSLAQLFGSLTSPIVSQQYSRKVALSAGFTLTALGLFSFTTLSAETSYTYLWFPFCLIGFGAGVAITGSAETAVGSVPKEESGMASGLQGTAMQLGGVLGTAVFGSIMSFAVRVFLGGNLYREDITPNMAESTVSHLDLVTQGISPTASTATAAAQAFVSGMHYIAIVAGSFCALAAVIGLFARGTDTGEMKPMRR